MIKNIRFMALVVSATVVVTLIVASGVAMAAATANDCTRYDTLCENGRVVLNFSANNTNCNWTTRISWGDGLSDTVFQGSHYPAVEKTHQYKRSGSYTITEQPTGSTSVPFGNCSGITTSFTVQVPATMRPPVPGTTLLSSGPTGTTTSSSASFSFYSTNYPNDPQVFLECSLDDGSYQDCGSGGNSLQPVVKNYSQLSAGPHTFKVRAYFWGDNSVKMVDQTPETRNWTVVDNTPPDTTISSGPSGPTNSKSLRG